MENFSDLQNLILAKYKKRDPNSFFDGLLAKYSEGGPDKSTKRAKKKGRGKGKGKGSHSKAKGTRRSTKGAKQKRSRPVQDPYDIDDDEFERIQKEMMARRKRVKPNTPKVKKFKGKKK